MACRIDELPHLCKIVTDQMARTNLNELFQICEEEFSAAKKESVRINQYRVPMNCKNGYLSGLPHSFSTTVAPQHRLIHQEKSNA